MAVTYDGDGNLTKIGNCDIDGLEEYPEIQTQTKSVTITQNGSITVTPDANKYLSSVGVTVNVPSPLLAKTVTFMNGENTHQIISTPSDIAIAKPTDPAVLSTQFFQGWKEQGGNSLVTFPYSPSENKTLEAQIINVRTNMEITDANTLLWKLNDVNYTKTNNGKSIAGGGWYWNGVKGKYYYSLILISEISDYCEITTTNSDLITGTATYDNKTYYYCGVGNPSNGNTGYNAYTNINEAFYTISGPSAQWGYPINTYITMVLDHYFCKD